MTAGGIYKEPEKPKSFLLAHPLLFTGSAIGGVILGWRGYAMYVSSGRASSRAVAQYAAWNSQVADLRPDISREAMPTFDRRFNKLAGALSESCTEPTPFDQYQSWDKWIVPTSQDAEADAQAMVGVLAEPATLTDGTVIGQVFDVDIGSASAGATCTCGTHEPVIAYNRARLSGLIPASLRFIKQHELAHFEKRHLKCKPNPVVDSAY